MKIPKQLRKGASILVGTVAKALAEEGDAAQATSPEPNPPPPPAPVAVTDAARKPAVPPADHSWVPAGIDLANPDAERARFARAVERLNAEGKPVKVQVAFGRHAREGFLNLDIDLNSHARAFFQANPDSVFIFPFANLTWPIPDRSVDFVFHEDFIEHIPQKLQIMFLAEVHRVLKPGSWHRVNTPCLLASLKRHCDFTKGSAGIYHTEWDRWGHQAIFTRYHLEELAKAVGYREVVFNGKNLSVSPHRTKETRPGDDRDQHVGNIFADLLK